MLLTNSQYEHLMSHYYHQQLKDNFILKKRMKEVYDAIPQMKRMEKLDSYTFGARVYTESVRIRFSNSFIWGIAS